jgi:hypothetical protein
MAERSRTNKIADGHKATQTKISRFGPSEPNRAAAQRAWTIANRNRPKSENPYLREKVYTAAVLARAQSHKAWAKENPERSDSENPYSWSEGRKLGQPSN